MNAGKKRAIEALSKPRNIILIILVNSFCGFELYEAITTGKVWFATRGRPDVYMISFSDHPDSFLYVLALCLCGMILFLLMPLLIVFLATRPDAATEPKRSTLQNDQ